MEVNITMRRGKMVFLAVIVALLASAGDAYCRNDRLDSLVRRGDSLRMKYRFQESLDEYSHALTVAKDTSQTADSSYMRILEDRILLSENGKSMSEYAYAPTVVAKHKFSINDFFLYYPLPDRSWRPLPNQLDTSSAHPFHKALYAPEGEDVIYYSAEDAQHIRNIYKTSLQDTLWTVPALLNEHMTSPADEIYPMLSADGKEIYFASSGLYGMGGYDLYVTRWDDEAQDWSVPENLGFPYSSPADDFLFINTADGNYTMFASDRDCSGDSVWVYVLAYDDVPVRRAVEDPEVLCQIASLDPKESAGKAANDDVGASMSDNADARRYMDKMSQVRALRDSIYNYSVDLENDRGRFAMSDDEDERMRLTNEILKVEARIPMLQDSLDKAMAQLQKIEMEFLFSGVVIDPDKLLEEADREVVGEATSYTFTKMSPGDSLHLEMMQPEVKFDYNFKVLEEGQFAEDNTIPSEGIIYQIQMYSSSYKAGIKDLKGLSPVFEHVTRSGKYIYRVGLFNSYNDVLGSLNMVKRAGFRSAFIVAFVDGQEVSVAKARTLEAEQKSEPLYYDVRIVPDGGEIYPELMAGINQQSGGKDVARVETEDGVLIYIVGPFADKAQAESLVDFIKAMGIGQVSCDLSGSDKNLNSF